MNKTIYEFQVPSITMGWPYSYLKLSLYHNPPVPSATPGYTLTVNQIFTQPEYSPWPRNLIGRDCTGQAAYKGMMPRRGIEALRAMLIIWLEPSQFTGKPVKFMKETVRVREVNTPYTIVGRPPLLIQAMGHFPSVYNERKDSKCILIGEKSKQVTVVERLIPENMVMLLFDQLVTLE